MGKLSPQTYKRVNTKKEYIAVEAAKTLGQRVRAMRLHRGLTQMQLAAKASISQPALSSIEIGDTQWVRGHTLVRIAEALEVTPKWVESGRVPAEHDAEPSQDAAHVLGLFNALSSPHQKVLLAAAEALLKSQTPVVPEPSRRRN